MGAELLHRDVKGTLSELRVSPHQPFIKESASVPSTSKARCYNSMCYANHPINNLKPYWVEQK